MDSFATSPPAGDAGRPTSTRPKPRCPVPVGDCIPDRNDPPPQGRGSGIPPSSSFRNFHPARAGG